MDELDNLTQKRELLTANLYKTLIQVIFLMVAPAIIAVAIGNFLKDNYETSSAVTFLLVAISVTASFIYVLKLYKKIDIEMVKIDCDIKKMRDKLGIPTKKYPKEEDKEN